MIIRKAAYRLRLSRSLITSTRPTFPPQNSLLPSFLRPSHDKYAEHTAMIDYISGASLTHGQIGELVGRIANRLVEWGVKPGDHIGVSAYNHIAYFPLSLGIMAAGARAAFCNPGYVERELEQLYRTADVSRVIGHPKNSQVVNAACKSLGLPEPLDIDKILDESASYSTQHPDITMLPHDTCSLFFSSGTTGFPKAVEITHDNFVSQCKILEDPEAFNFTTETVNNGFLPSFHVFGSVVGMHVLQAGARAVVLDGFNPESFLGTNQKYKNGFLPMFHLFGGAVGMHALHNGSLVVVLDGFQPETFLGANQKFKVTFATVVPPIMLFLAKHPLVDQYDQSSLRHLICAAAPCSKQLEDDVKRRLNNPDLSFRQGYGLSETTAISHHRSPTNTKIGSNCVGSMARNTVCKISTSLVKTFKYRDYTAVRSVNSINLTAESYGLSETTAACHFLSTGKEKQGSIGSIANNTQCKVVDISTGKECGIEEKGELYIKGPCVMKGYYKNVKATQETMTEDGFLKTGDIGYYDEDGDFFIIDRVKEFIKVKGFQVAPAELEALLLENPKIADAAVIGIPNERSGEAPKAFVVKHPNVELTEEDVIKFVSKNVIDYKVPAEVEFISVVPKLPSGKIQRKVLRAAEEEKRKGK